MSIMGNWSENYNSWKNFNLTKKIIIKYEDLLKNTKKVVNELSYFFEQNYNFKFKNKKFLIDAMLVTIAGIAAAMKNVG